MSKKELLLTLATIIAIITTLILFLNIYCEGIKEKSGEDSITYKICMKGIKGEENIKEGAERAKDIVEVMPENKKKK